MKKHTAIFTNFILHFGSDKVLADGFESVVIPAFTDPKLVRKYGETRYQFHEVQLLTFDEGSEKTLAIAGRFIQTTVLKREQVYDDILGLIPDEATLESSPSAFFLLIINDHRLVYFGETNNAPDIDRFKLTIYRFLREKHREFIDFTHKQSIEKGEKKTKKALIAEFGIPYLEILPIISSSNIRQFASQYAVLKKVEFRLIRPNDDLRAGEIFEDLRSVLESMKSSNAKVVASNPDGLDIDRSVEAIVDAGAGDNQEIVLHGTDKDGNSIHGNNDNMQIQVELSNPQTEPLSLASQLLSSLRNLQQQGTIRKPTENKKTTDFIRRFLDAR
ncbi:MULTISPECIES: hypothetical protein [Alphaproteobacteria]|uniref:Uncharacterized protein n=2 Tax=Alphaproteobacteria TaxID=28211 RepID=A0A512HE50_9HYPH|nr:MULTISPECIES: hypothetical protein [Alphaproteobacteria]GEO83726.1 hypothetical protein RNA01_06580 [Ciceribacter naphthalenivorans]GLR24122.1 hypothetical protein GCM10007920_39160 [Ciceribacter naphthalenivorans]GLT06978.1 hypothetical protein GCM10007926_39160 [Sphingomonas psychrolutea]